MHVKNVILLTALIVGLGLMPTSRATAQIFTTLHSFTVVNTNSTGDYTNSDGAVPNSLSLLSSNTLYGDTTGGGTYGNGTLFKMKTDGTGFTNLYSFAPGKTNSLGIYTNSDGCAPNDGLILSGSTIYGMANSGGTNGSGTVFKINTDGTGFTNLYNFTALKNNTNSDGYGPEGGLVLGGSTLFGTANEGGKFGNGTVFAISTNGVGFTNLHNFTALVFDLNSDGANPNACLILSGSTLYGTAEFGGATSHGSVFAISTNGTSFTNLHSFTTSFVNSLGNQTNSEGFNPNSSLVLSNNTLFGTAISGGSMGAGTVFAVNTNGTFTTLHSFTFPVSPDYSNNDGASPYAGLTLSGSTLYGTASEGGKFGNGTVFAISTNGTGFTTLHNFTTTLNGTNSDGFLGGGFPQPSLAISSNTLYGVAWIGGTGGNGTVFSISFTPQLTIIPSGTNVILSWPTNVAGFDYTGFTLKSATNLVPTAAWGAVSPTPVVVSGQDTVTNTASGTQMFYRLSQ